VNFRAFFPSSPSVRRCRRQAGRSARPENRRKSGCNPVVEAHSIGTSPWGHTTDAAVPEQRDELAFADGGRDVAEASDPPRRSLEVPRASRSRVTRTSFAEPSAAAYLWRP